MKKVLRLATMAAFMFITSLGMANEPKLNVVAETNAKSLVFELDASPKETTIKFIDAEGNIMYSEAVSGKTRYFKKFNLHELSKGRYFLKIDNPLREIVYTVSVDSKDVEIIDKKENAKPIFRNKNGMVYLNFLNLGKREVEVKVYDSSNRLLFETAVNNKLKIEKAFNFTDAHKDTYTVMVKNGNGIYHKDIVIN